MNRGERKCRKALTKIGFQPFNVGVTRVTLRKRDGLIFVVNEPEVLRYDGKSFAVFGELKLEDPSMRMQQAEAKKFAESQMAAAQAQAASAKPVAKAAASDAKPADEAGLTPNHINLVMEHTNCTRNEAIAALRETNDDMINAVMKLTK